MTEPLQGAPSAVVASLCLGSGLWRWQNSTRQPTLQSHSHYTNTSSDAFTHTRCSTSSNRDCDNGKSSYVTNFRAVGGARRRAASGISCAATTVHHGGHAHAAHPWPFYRGGGKTAANEHRTQKRVLILMSDTGGGHRASAQAIKAGFEALYGDAYHFDIVDMWTDHTYFPFNRAAGSYSFMVKYPILWRLGYTLTQPRIVHVPTQQVMGLLVGRQVSKAYAQYKPDLVVSVHPLMQGVPLRVLKQRIKQGLQDPINFATVVTDLCTCHNTWFSKDVDKCFVATETTAERARSMGLDDRQIVVHGLPIRPAFSKRPPPKAELRESLGMQLDVPAVLVVAGGEGMGPVEKTCTAIADACGVEVQLVVVCGRNAKLAQRLNTRNWPEGMLIHVQGFVNNMEQWMHACDIIITKAGPGTIAESLICGLPVLLNGYIPGQEEGNIEYVQQHKVGAFERDPSKLAVYVKKWITAAADTTADFHGMVKRAKALGTPESLTRICKDLAALAEHPTFFTGREKAPMALQPS